MKLKVKDIVKAMQSIESDHNISKEIVLEALKEALAKAYRKHIEMPDCLVTVDIDAKGNINVYHDRLVVEDVEDSEFEISLEDAKAISQDYALGDTVGTKVEIAEFGRAAVILAKNVLRQKIKEAEKQAVYDEYCDKLEDMVTGVVETVEEKFCLVSIGEKKTLALMPKVAQIPTETYREGQTIKVVISSVNKDTKGAQVLVSRADASLVKRLFEKEVPEIYKGEIEIKAIAREPGERCKMAVYAHRDTLDPIGTCIGLKGARVNAVIEELHGEKIDIFEWSEDETELIKNALAPAKIQAVIPNPYKYGLMVIVEDDQLSLAIGKKGKNARLAVKLTNNTIDIKSISDVDADGIDWRTIAKERQEELARMKEEARAKAQKEAFDKLKDEENKEMEFDEELFDNEVIEEEFNPTEENTMATAEAEEKEVIEEVAEETVVEETTVQEEVVEEVKEESELERIARLVKEKKAKEGINIEEKRSYVSKFEDFGESKPKPQKAAKKSYKKKEETDEIVRDEPTYELKEKDYAFKPIYTEEELAEIEEQERLEEEKDWINDDEIDYDEYDSYYD